MKRSWITALTLAAVAGSGAAFTGVIVNSDDRPAVAAEPIVVNQVSPARVERPVPTTRTTSYQVGAAGVATLLSANGSLTVDTVVANTGWAMTSASGPGTHIDVLFTDGIQLVTFGADLVGNEVVVSVTNVSSTPATTAPAEVVQVAVTEPVETTPTPPQATPRPVAARSLGDDASDDDHHSEPDDD